MLLADKKTKKKQRCQIRAWSAHQKQPPSSFWSENLVPFESAKLQRSEREAQAAALIGFREEQRLQHELQSTLDVDHKRSNTALQTEGGTSQINNYSFCFDWTMHFGTLTVQQNAPSTLSPTLIWKTPTVIHRKPQSGHNGKQQSC